MSKPVTCIICHGDVDDADAVEMPNGMVCLDPCYVMLERLIEEAEEQFGDDEIEIEFESDVEWD